MIAVGDGYPFTLAFPDELAHELTERRKHVIVSLPIGSALPENVRRFFTNLIRHFSHDPQQVFRLRASRSMECTSSSSPSRKY